MAEPASQPSASAARELFAQGNSFREQGRWHDALTAFRAAIAADPGLAQAHVNVGYILEQTGDLDGAAAAYTTAVKLVPELHAAVFNLGSVSIKRGDFDGAVIAARRAVALQPDHALSHLLLANVHRLRNELAEAERACRQAIVLAPERADGWTNLANILRAQNRIADALLASDHALSLDPDSAPAHINKAMALLVLGDLRAGWPHAEYRHVLKLGGAGRELPLPKWDGRQSLAGKRILLHAEQGFGDSIHFLRYVPGVCALGARVTVELQPPLVALAQASFGGMAAVISRGDPLPAFDLHCPLPSLPWAFETDLATIPANTPYLNVPAAYRKRWTDLRGDSPALKVGLAWCGNPTHPNDENRSIRLAQLVPIVRESTGATFYSLKKDMPAADAAILETVREVTNLAPRLENFADAAAAIEQLDLVIAVDTSVAHLAGALGKPVWVLLPFSPDWRWLLEREDSPWYPTARLFRQSRPGNWDPVVAQIGKALRTVSQRTP